MPKKRVYVESSVISYLTARPSNDILKLAKQRQTQIWWEQRERWELFVAPPVMVEIRRGNRDAAAKRTNVANTLPLLPITPDVWLLAEKLHAFGVIPRNSAEDAMHVAIASVCVVDYLVTWNQKHIFNPNTMEKLYATIRGAGYKPPVLVRPDNLLEMNHGS